MKVLIAEYYLVCVFVLLNSLQNDGFGTNTAFQFKRMFSGYREVELRFIYLVIHEASCSSKGFVME